MVCGRPRPGQRLNQSLCFWRNPPLLGSNGELIEQEPGANVFVTNKTLAANEGTNRYGPAKKESTALNLQKVIITERLPNGKFASNTRTMPFEKLEILRAQAEDNPDLEVKIYEKPETYYDNETGKSITMTLSKFTEAEKNEPGRYTYEPPEAVAMRLEDEKAEKAELRAGKDKVRKEYYAAANLADIYENMVDSIQEMQNKGIGLGTGNVGGFVTVLDNISGGVEEVFKMIKADNPNHNAQYEEAALQVEKLLSEEKNVDGSIAKYLSMEEATAGGRAQTIKSMLTQFVYAVAKSRESGGKFSVSDIDFAFMSAGQGSKPENILRGMSAVMEPILEDKIRQVKAYFKNADGSTMTDLDLWKHETLGQAQNVLRIYKNLNDQYIPEEWYKFDNSPDKEFNDPAKRKQKNQTIFQKMLDAAKKNKEKEK